MGVIVILLYFVLPAGIIFLSTRFSIINKIGVVVICYAVGLIMGNVNMIPESISGFQGDLMGVTILLGIPLVLFSENVLKWVKWPDTPFCRCSLGWFQWWFWFL